MNRLTDNDKTWGPFTLARWGKRISFELRSGDDEDPECNLLVVAFGWAFRVMLPNIIKPFGKYKDRLIIELPVFYLEWFASKGFPSGKLGMMLSTIHIIRTNGLEHLLRPLRKG